MTKKLNGSGKMLGEYEMLKMKRKSQLRDSIFKIIGDKEIDMADILLLIVAIEDKQIPYLRIDWTEK